MQVSAKTDYALRAASELALAATEDAGPIKGDWISETQGIPKKFIENIELGEEAERSPRGYVQYLVRVRPSGRET